MNFIFLFLLVKDIFSGWLDSESWVVWSSGAIESRIRKAERTPLSGGAAATIFSPISRMITAPAQPLESFSFSVYFAEAAK